MELPDREHASGQKASRLAWTEQRDILTWCDGSNYDPSPTPTIPDSEHFWRPTSRSFSGAGSAAIRRTGQVWRLLLGDRVHELGQVEHGPTQRSQILGGDLAMSGRAVRL